MLVCTGDVRKATIFPVEVPQSNVLSKIVASVGTNHRIKFVAFFERELLDFDGGSLARVSRRQHCFYRKDKKKYKVLAEVGLDIRTSQRKTGREQA